MGCRLDSDLAFRLVAVVVVAAMVVAVARFRPRRRGPALRVEGNLEGPGVYLFTASACDSCDSARAVYLEELGADGFTELTWDDRPGLLTRLGVGEIPVSTVLDFSGREVDSFLGVPPRRALRKAMRRMRA